MCASAAVNALNGSGLFPGRQVILRLAQDEQYRRMYRLEEDIVNQKQRTHGSWFFKAHRCATAVAVAVVTTTALCTEQAGARDRPATPEEREACTPDVFRFCGSHIPDAGAITACLRAKFTNLSDQCRYVISVRDSAKGKEGSK